MDDALARMDPLSFALAMLSAVNKDNAPSKEALMLFLKETAEKLKILNDLGDFDKPAPAAVGSHMYTFVNVQCVQPRGRFDVAVHRNGVMLKKAAGGASAAAPPVVALWGNVRDILRVSKPNPYKKSEMHVLFALTLGSPILNKKQKVLNIVLQVDGGGEKKELVPLDEFHLEDDASVVLNGYVLPDAFGEILSISSSMPVHKEDKGVFKGAPIPCYNGTNEGALYPLPAGLLFFKPLVFLPAVEISEVVCGRGGAANTRYVDLQIALDRRGTSDDGNLLPSEYEFTNIVRDDLPRLQGYLEHLKRVRGKAEKKKEAASKKKVLEEGEGGAAAAAAAAAASVPDEELDSDSDDDESDDDDFKPEGGDESGSDSDDNSGSGSCDSSSDDDGGSDDDDDEMDDSGFGPGGLDAGDATESDDELSPKRLPVVVEGNEAEEEESESPLKKQRVG